MPPGRWPCPGGHPLTLLQQAAVNDATVRLARGGLAAVNGPPGTGKTTLMRDLVAHVVISRAIDLAKVENPAEAMRTGYLGFSLMDTAMVVASTNNAAVENISTELPLKSALREDLRDSAAASYFPEVADNLVGQPGSCWGLAAAKLGNSANRAAFTNGFWFNEQVSMRTVLANAPNDAEKRWQAARKNFKTILDQAVLFKAHGEARWLKEAGIAALAARLNAVRDRHPEAVEKALAALAMARPRPAKFCERLFRLRAGREAAAHKAQIAEAFAPLAQEPGLSPSDVLKAVAAVGEGISPADIMLWGEEDQTLRLAAPWNHGRLRTARDDVFVAAFALHKAFIEAAAAPLRQLLGAAIDIVSGKSRKDGVKPDQALGALFLVCPVVSTTFASFGRMFAALGPESIGWLLVDEAGQAAPQAAVGALWRARRAVVVGDPLQIPPVVTHPELTTRLVFASLGAKAAGWTAPADSVQTLADRANPIRAVFDADGTPREVGLPLLVHRRCQEPMFSLANTIAYDGKMLLASGAAKSKLVDLLGRSAWIDVQGRPDGKWVPEEGELVLDALRQAAQAGITPPNLYVISPFRDPAYRMRLLVTQAEDVLPGLDRDARKAWAEKNIGTVHTFQGKEAEGVIVLLGASGQACAPARAWAGSEPNLLNVAATRAKQGLWVIGNRAEWASAGCFGKAAQMLPATTAWKAQMASA